MLRRLDELDITLEQLVDELVDLDALVLGTRREIVTDLRNSRIQTLERRLEALLSLPQYSGDDRRLARVYVGFGRLVVDRLEPTLVTHLTRAEEYARTNVFPEELEGVSHELGIVAQQLSYQESQSGIETDQPFLYQLLESCTRREFAIYPATDVEPVARMAAIGVPADDIEGVVYSVYPELRSR